jgi:hypothetical protein
MITTAQRERRGCDRPWSLPQRLSAQSRIGVAGDAVQVKARLMHIVQRGPTYRVVMARSVWFLTS